MMKFLGLILAVLIIYGCQGKSSEQEIKFSDGETGKIELETKQESKNEKVLHVTFTNDKMVVKESTVEKQVEEIWNSVKAKAESQEIDEGLIKYLFIAGLDEEHQKPIYQILLFETTRFENGNWKIRKIN